MIEQYHCYGLEPIDQTKAAAVLLVASSPQDAAERFGLVLDASDGAQPDERVVMVRKFWINEQWQRVTIRPVRRYQADPLHGEQEVKGGEG